jgi:hypothetical protein
LIIVAVEFFQVFTSFFVKKLPNNIDLKQCRSNTKGFSSVKNFLTEGNSRNSRVIGSEILPIIAEVGEGNNSNDDNFIKAKISRPLSLICGLKSNYKELILVFGINNTNQHSSSKNEIKFSVYLDNKLAGIKTVIYREATPRSSLYPSSKQRWPLQLSGERYVTLNVECTTKTCPPLSFTEMTLRNLSH